MTPEEMEKKIGELQRTLIGQTSMIALLIGLLVDKGTLSREEAATVAAAGITGKLPANLKPQQVLEWIRREKGTRPTPPPVPPSPPSSG